MRNDNASFSNTNGSTSKPVDDVSAGNRTEQSSTTNNNTAEGGSQQWANPFLRLVPKIETSRQEIEKEPGNEYNEEDARQTAENAQVGGIFSRFGRNRGGGNHDNDADKMNNVNGTEKLHSSNNDNNQNNTQQAGGGIFSFFQAAKAEMEEKAKRKAEEEAKAQAEKAAALKAEAKAKAMQEAMKDSGWSDDLVDDDDSDSCSKNGGESSLVSLTASEISEINRVHIDLKEKGLPSELTLHDEKNRHDDHDSHSCVSWGEESYIRDLMGQQAHREESIREEALEEAAKLYLVATEEKGLPESEELFQLILAEAKKEIIEREEDKALMQDGILEQKKHVVQQIIEKQKERENNGGLRQKLANFLPLRWR